MKKASYAVRGPIVSKSLELSKQLQSPNHKLPFKKIISCNIGNPHSLEQKPLTYSRDILSLVMNPSLKHRMTFSNDIVKKAERYLNAIPGVGAYTESQGIYVVREDISKFLYERDGYESDPNDIFLTNGASEGVRLCLQTFLREPKSGYSDGILAPIPQYPLYSALASLLDASLVPYYLDESRNWGCSSAMLSASLANAKEKGISIRGLVVINPGNPTGQVLEESDMRSILEFCSKEGICLMADEVYQENIWKKGSKFISFRKVAYDMKKDSPASIKDLQMISFHSISKGFYGECGLRGGYFELFGIPLDVKAELYKLASISLCSNTIGQIATGLMVQPPVSGRISYHLLDYIIHYFNTIQCIYIILYHILYIIISIIGEESYELYITERDNILASLRRRAELLSISLNKLEGISCNSIDGALYAFPTIQLPGMKKH